jgi:RNA polymerase sigma-70 factor (ECF subfamily)
MNVPGADAEPDAELIERSRRGDAQAFDRIVARYRGDVYRISHRMTGNHEDADDVAQETFLRAFRALPGFRGDSALRTWLFRIAMNLAINIGRARSTHPTESYDDPDSGRPEPSEAPSEERRILAGEQARRVRAAVDGLPPRQRQVVILRMYEELQFNEIASVLDCPIGTAKANFFHAMNNLRKALA